MILSQSDYLWLTFWITPVGDELKYRLKRLIRVRSRENKPLLIRTIAYNEFVDNILN